jgi:carbonic anhydrase
MDARVDPWRLLSAGVGDIHVIRNAGGLVTPDAERSLVASQRKLETTRVDVIMHTQCGMLGMDEDALNAELAAAGAAPMDFGSFDDLDAALRRSVALLRSNPALLHRDSIRGYVYDIDAGALRLLIDA